MENLLKGLLLEILFTVILWIVMLCGVWKICELCLDFCRWLW